MTKDIYVSEECVKIVEHKRKFLSTEIEDKEYTIPVHLIKLVQKAYTSEGTSSLAIFLETENEFFITYDEAEDIDRVFEELVALKKDTNKFRAELYNIETCGTIDK